MTQPSLTVTALAPQIGERLSQEWSAWVDRVDRFVNKEGGMFSGEVVQGWATALDGFATQDSPLANDLRAIRDSWVARAGWLIGRRAPSVSMDEEI